MSTQKNFSLVYSNKLLLSRSINELKENIEEAYTYIKEDDRFREANYLSFFKNYGKIRFKKVLLKQLSDGGLYLTLETPNIKSQKTEVQYLDKVQLEILIDVLEINKEHSREDYFDYNEIFEQVRDYLEFTKGKLMKNFNPWNHYKGLKKVEERVKRNKKNQEN
jgi:hypothetical protein